MAEPQESMYSECDRSSPDPFLSKVMTLYMYMGCTRDLAEKKSSRSRPLSRNGSWSALGVQRDIPILPVQYSISPANLTRHNIKFLNSLESISPQIPWIISILITRMPHGKPLTSTHGARARCREFPSCIVHE
jgi:hypothetical protein